MKVVKGTSAMGESDWGWPLSALRRLLAVAAFVALGGIAMAQEGRALADRPGDITALPDPLEDQREIDDWKREREKQELRNEVEALRGLQTTELETKHVQLEKLKSLAELNLEVRELLQNSPELRPVYQQVIAVDGAAPGCDCLSRVELNYVGSGTRTGVAILSLDGQAAGFRRGDPLGSTACRVDDVGDADVTIRCGGAVCTHRLGRPADCPR